MRLRAVRNTEEFRERNFLSYSRPGAPKLEYKYTQEYILTF